jgi:uncharacterized protein (DUF2235 family)
MAVRKNIIVCSDGTGNTAIKGRGTNVFKLFEAVDLHGHRTNPAFEPQLAIYDDGVGTESFKLLKLLGGAFGWGLGTNVCQLYKELARVYDGGDRIFLFGFSRGAFTVRTLAGMIARCGIVRAGTTASRAELDAAVADTYAAYRAGYDSTLTRLIGRVLGWKDGASAIAELHARYAGKFHVDPPITFIGVWDTVDAVGLPLPISAWFNERIYQFKFRTQDLSKNVERAAHALAIDDARRSFTPVLWTQPPPDPKRPAGEGPIVEQVWFAGAHSNVGGGYPKQGMSLVALEWLLERAARCGLHVQKLDLDVIRGHASVDDKLYDPRSGVGILYRWAPRRIRDLSPTGVPIQVHLSVLERLAHGTDDYAPGNLPFDAKVVFTRTGDAAADDFLQRRASAVEGVLARAGAGKNGDLLADVSGPIAVGTASYWLFMASWIALLAGPVVMWWRTHALGPMLLGLVPGIVGFVVAWALAWYADARMEDRFSTFWHSWQRELRLALRSARERSRGMPPPPPSPPLSIGPISPP